MDGTDIVYFVGFQVDLVAQANTILRNIQGRSYQIDYCLPKPPQRPLPQASKVGSTFGLSKAIFNVMSSRINVAGFGQGEEGGKWNG